MSGLCPDMDRWCTRIRRFARRQGGMRDPIRGKSTPAGISKQDTLPNDWDFWKMSGCLLGDPPSKIGGGFFGVPFKQP